MTERPSLMTDRPKDVLSDVLGAVRLRGAVFFSVTARVPWVAESATGSALAPFVLPGAEHVIAYHIVTATSGGCYAQMDGVNSQPLEAGDIIVFPHGDSHVMANTRDARGQ